MKKIILPYITTNISNNPHQHGFKAHHSISTALHQLTNQITQGFNKPQLPDHTIVVSLDLSNAFDTFNILTHPQTTSDQHPTHHHQIHIKLHHRQKRTHTVS